MLNESNQLFDKNFNFRSVLEFIRIHGPISRIDIAKQTNMTAQTVTNITRDLLEMGFVKEFAKVQDGRGAPSIQLDINPDGAFSIGLDLDEEHITGLLVNMKGDVLQRISLDLSETDPEFALQLMTDISKDLIKRSGIKNESSILGVGVGIPGPLNFNNETKEELVNPIALKQWKDVPLASLLSERLGLKVYLENNATSAAISERWFGEGRLINTYFYIFLGSGLGGGLFVNGKVYSGQSGNAGEIGYFPLGWMSISERNSNLKDHLGQFFNIKALYRSLQDLGINADRPYHLENLLRMKNGPFMTWLENAAENLAPFVLGIEYLFDPEAIIFGGRIPQIIVQELINRIEVKISEMRIDRKIAYTPLRLGSVGIDCSSLGAATIPLYQNLAPLPKRGRGKSTKMPGY